jgi:hypothetical protein
VTNRERLTDAGWVALGSVCMVIDAAGRKLAEIRDALLRWNWGLLAALALNALAWVGIWVAAVAAWGWVVSP